MQRQSIELIEQVRKIIHSYDFALTLRQIYYQLVAKQIIPNKQKYYKKLSRLCVIGRDERLLDENAFADRLRQVDKPASWIDINDFMVAVRQSYNKDKWQNQKRYIEIWTEKDALRNVLSAVTYPYDVNLMIVRGQVSRTAIYEAYKRYSSQFKYGKGCYLYYAGDFDPSGLSIYNSLVERIRKYGNGDGLLIKFKRIALNQEQIKKYKLPSDPGKQTDPNYKRFIAEYGDNVVELDSLPPDILRKLIENYIVENIDFSLLEQVQKAEAKEKERLQGLKL